jgi:hydrogenase expression/formation protein HypE
MAVTAGEAGVTIVTGDTKIVGGSDLNSLIITTSGIGVVKFDSSIQRVEPGDILIVSGTIGEHASAILVSREGGSASMRILVANSETHPFKRLS